MIHVLLATFKPDPGMLSAQVESIVSQHGVEVNLIIREDKEGKGACANFSALLDIAAKGISDDDYVAFSDQDDVWLDDKLVKTLAKMREMEAEYGKTTPLLVFTDAKVVDKDLKLLSSSLFGRTKLDPHILNPNRLILQNIGNGNTMLLNAALVRKAIPIPECAFMHDHWIALVASVFGKAGYLDEPTLLYRQHDANVLGGAKVDLGYFWRRFMNGRRNLRRRLHAYMAQAEAFALRFSDAPPCFKACIGFAKRGFLSRRLVVLKHRIFKQGLLRNLGVFFAI